jgi:hypothetical protein
LAPGIATVTASNIRIQRSANWAMEASPPIFRIIECVQKLDAEHAREEAEG